MTATSDHIDYNIHSEYKTFYLCHHLSPLSFQRLFHFDCFCDLKISEGGPNYDYTLKIRSLPFQNENCTLVDDQTVTSYVKVPGMFIPYNLNLKFLKIHTLVC